MSELRKKVRTAFYCSRCGAEHPRWQGQCRECGEWNSLIEERVPVAAKQRTTGKRGEVHPLNEISLEATAGLTSGMAEVDRVLGGSLVPGMAVLIGGEPGIGKSTLLLQLASAYARRGASVLYVTGEESPAQIRLRAERLTLTGVAIDVMYSNEVEEILETAGDKYRVVIVDSIQTVSSAQFDSPPGTVAQVRESAHQLITRARATHAAMFLVGHVTKDGMVAGPKVLEHMVDTVLYFEGESTHLYRMLRAVKNRFGSVSEVGIFEMQANGLREISNPSSIFLTSHASGPRVGTAVCAVCEGNRPLLVEIQALVTPANYGSPQRVAGGLDSKRLSLLLAIIEKRCEYPVGSHDVFVSIAGGLKVGEPAVDLAVICAIISSFRNIPLSPRLMICGEAGLAGEVRGVPLIERRIQESLRLGFERLVVPAMNLRSLDSTPPEVTGVETLTAAIESALMRDTRAR